MADVPLAPGLSFLCTPNLEPVVPLLPFSSCSSAKPQQVLGAGTLPCQCVDAALAVSSSLAPIARQLGILGPSSVLHGNGSTPPTGVKPPRAPKGVIVLDVVTIMAWAVGEEVQSGGCIAGREEGRGRGMDWEASF